MVFCLFCAGSSSAEPLLFRFAPSTIRSLFVTKGTEIGRGSALSAVLVVGCAVFPKRALAKTLRELVAGETASGGVVVVALLVVFEALGVATIGVVVAAVAAAGTKDDGNVVAVVVAAAVVVVVAVVETAMEAVVARLRDLLRLCLLLLRFLLAFFSTSMPATMGDTKTALNQAPNN